MMKRLFPYNRLLFKETLRRVDRVAADLNVLLVVVAFSRVDYEAPRWADAPPPVAKLGATPAAFRDVLTASRVVKPVLPAIIRQPKPVRRWLAY